MQNAVKVLIAEDEPNALAGLAELISGWGYRTETARDGVEAWEKALAWDPAIVVTDLKMPRMDGMGLLAKLAEGGEGLSANMAVVVLTAMGSIQLAVDAMKLGAYDFLQKPVDADAAEDHPGQRHATAGNRDRAGSGAPPAARDRRAGPAGRQLAQAMREIFSADRAGCALERARADHRRERHGQGAGGAHAARSEPAQGAAVCRGQLRGDSGNADRKRNLRPREGLVHRARSSAAPAASSWPRAARCCWTRWARCRHGTQAKLLRVLEERKFRRLGARTEQDSRTCACWRRPIAIREVPSPRAICAPTSFTGSMSSTSHMPPLRDHLDDLPAMVEAMVREMNQKHGRKVSGVSPSMLERLMAAQLAGQRARTAQHHRAGGDSLPRWRAARGRDICRRDSAKIRQQAASADGSSITVRVGATVDEAERLLILRTLEATGQNKTRAAEILGVSLKTLHNKLKEYGREHVRK